jgi:hypothetical protein
MASSDKQIEAHISSSSSGKQLPERAISKSARYDPSTCVRQQNAATKFILVVVDKKQTRSFITASSILDLVVEPDHLSIRRLLDCRGIHGRDTPRVRRLLNDFFDLVTYQYDCDDDDDDDDDTTVGLPWNPAAPLRLKTCTELQPLYEEIAAAPICLCHMRILFDDNARDKLDGTVVVWDRSREE